MGLKQHLPSVAWTVCLASCAALAAWQARAEPPPGSDAPVEYGEAKVETIIVIGSNYRCPDGTIVTDIALCPEFQSFWWDTYFFVTPTANGIIPKYQAAAPPCGSQPDANCACGSGKVKVYDDGNDTFHCKTEPPAAGCPEWDQTFNFDLKVWACETRPLDATALAAADRIKGCFGTGSTIHKFWNNAKFEYGTCPGHPQVLGCVVSCGAGGADNLIRFNKGNIGSVRYDNQNNPIDATEWQWFAEALNHELRHVRHNVLYGCQPWNNLSFWLGERVPTSVPTGQPGEEIFTGIKALEEYNQELGVKSPYDQAYKPANDKQLPNCRLW